MMKRLIPLSLCLFFSNFIAAKDPFLSSEFNQLLQSAERGNPDIQYQIAKRYYTGAGVPSDKINAITWLNKSAEQGYLPAQKALGILYLDGDGSVLAIPEKGVEWLVKAAEQNDGEAQGLLAKIYKEGKLAPLDYEKARYWAELGASQHNPMAEYFLGTLNHFGLGIEKNLTKAANLYQQAAEQGYLEALNNIGGMYFAGLGVSKNIVLGYAYWAVAKQLGSLSAARNMALKDQKNALTTTEKAQAEQLAQQILAKIAKK